MNFWMPQTGKMGDGWALCLYYEQDTGIQTDASDKPDVHTRTGWLFRGRGQRADIGMVCVLGAWFYPVCPGLDQYVLGTPLFPKATIHFENGKKVEIVALGTGDIRRYIDRMKLNKRVYTKNYITHKDLHGGGRIEFRMSERPNRSRGIGDVDFPCSFWKDREGCLLERIFYIYMNYRYLYSM